MNLTEGFPSFYWATTIASSVRLYMNDPAKTFVTANSV